MSAGYAVAIVVAGMACCCCAYLCICAGLRKSLGNIAGVGHELHGMHWKDAIQASTFRRRMQPIAHLRKAALVVRQDKSKGPLKVLQVPPCKVKPGKGQVQDECVSVVLTLVVDDTGRVKWLQYVDDGLKIFYSEILHREGVPADFFSAA